METICMPVQAEGQVPPEKSACHSIATPSKFSEKDISLLLPRACSTINKIVERYALWRPWSNVSC
jgi:hypothetical protein